MESIVGVDPLASIREAFSSVPTAMKEHSVVQDLRSLGCALGGNCGTPSLFSPNSAFWPQKSGCFASSRPARMCCIS